MACHFLCHCLVNIWKGLVNVCLKLRWNTSKTLKLWAMVNSIFLVFRCKNIHHSRVKMNKPESTGKPGPVSASRVSAAAAVPGYDGRSSNRIVSPHHRLVTSWLFQILEYHGDSTNPLTIHQWGGFILGTSFILCPLNHQHQEGVVQLHFQAPLGSCQRHFSHRFVEGTPLKKNMAWRIQSLNHDSHVLNSKRQYVHHNVSSETCFQPDNHSCFSNLHKPTCWQIQGYNFWSQLAEASPRTLWSYVKKTYW